MAHKGRAIGMRWQENNQGGGKHVLRLAYTSFMSKVHSLQKFNGTTYYLINCFGKTSSVDGYEMKNTVNIMIIFW